MERDNNELVKMKRSIDIHTKKAGCASEEETKEGKDDTDQVCRCPL